MRSRGRSGICVKFVGLGLQNGGFEVPAVPVGTQPRSWALTPGFLPGAGESRGGRGEALGGPWPLGFPGSLPAALGPRWAPRFSWSLFWKPAPSRAGHSSPRGLLLACCRGDGISWTPSGRSCAAHGPQPVSGGGSDSVSERASTRAGGGFSGPCGERQPQDVPTKQKANVPSGALREEERHVPEEILGPITSVCGRRFPGRSEEHGPSRAHSGRCPAWRGGRFVGLMEGGFRGLSNTARPRDRDLGKTPARVHGGSLGSPGHQTPGAAAPHIQPAVPFQNGGSPPWTRLCVRPSPSLGAVLVLGAPRWVSVQGRAVHKRVGFLLLTAAGRPGARQSGEPGASVPMLCSVGTGWL